MNADIDTLGHAVVVVSLIISATAAVFAIYIAFGGTK